MGKRRRVDHRPDLWDREQQRWEERQKQAAADDPMFAAFVGHGTPEASAARAAADMERGAALCVSPAPPGRSGVRADGVDFNTWCKTGGLDRDFVRQNYSLVRKRYEDGFSMTGISPPKFHRAYDRYDELGD